MVGRVGQARHVDPGQELLDEGPVVEDRDLRDEQAPVALEVHQLLGQQEGAPVELGHQAARLVGHAAHPRWVRSRRRMARTLRWWASTPWALAICS